MNPRTLVLSWLRTHTRGRPSDASVTIPVSELLGLEEQLVDAPKGGKGSRLPRKQRGMTSRSKQRRKPDTAYLEFVRGHLCCACDSHLSIEAHHTGKRGLGQKAPDHTAIPLCLRCHHWFHDRGLLPVFLEGARVDRSKAESTELVLRTITELQAEWAELHKEDTF